MRSLFIIMILGISTKVWAQFPPDSMISLFNFNEIEVKISDSSKLSLLQKLVSTKYFPVSIKSAKYRRFSSYHIVDFNDDGLLDVIYDSKRPDGIETNNVAFFLNNGDSLELVIKLNGDFTRMDIQDGGLTGFQLIYSPCCNDHIYSIRNFILADTANCYKPLNSKNEQYKYSYGEVNEPKFCVSYKSVIRYMRGTAFPFFKERPDTMIFNQDTFLRSSFSKGNRVEPIISEGTKCVVLAEMRVEGNTFCFVLVEMRDTKLNIHKGLGVFYYGWINTKFIE